jgi:tetratricopeptide (TPR) repeat protein
MTRRKLGNDAPHPRTAVLAPTPHVPFVQRRWVLALVVAVVTFAAYFPALRGGFIWDDDDHVTGNPAMTAPHGLRMIWSSLAVSRYYPLTLTNLWIQRRCWGLNPMPYHLVTIALHAINGILVFLVLRRLRVPAAWLAAMLWVLHPVNVESVAWITETKNTQSGAFFFLALLCFLRFEDDKERRWYALALMCGLAAMLSKPSTVVLPLVLLLCVWWQRNRWRWLDLVRIAPFFGLALGTSALTIIEQRGHIVRDGTTDWNLGVAQRLIVASKAVWFYAAKVFWPVKLMFVYPRWDVQTDSFTSWLPLATLVAAGLVLWVWRRQDRVRAMLLGIAFFVIALLPVLGFVDVYYFRYSYVADHFQYLACIGLIPLAVGAGRIICERAGPWGRNLGTLAAVIVLLILGVCTWGQARTYQDSETLWRDTLAKNPTAWMAHNNLGVVLQQSGREAEAIERYEQSLQINPKNAEAHNNLGNVLLQEGKVSDAIGQYEQALRIKPNYAEAHYNLGIVLEHTGNVREAVDHFEQALQSKPDYAGVHYDLGLALAQLGRMPEARAHWEEALRLNPDYAEAHYNLGLALAQLGRVQEAIEHYEQALRLKPDYAGAHYDLGLALAQLGRMPEAVGHWEEALRLNPDYAEPHYALGIALEQAGRPRDAIGHYEQALRIKPDFTAARNALARLQARQ